MRQENLKTQNLVQVRCTLVKEPTYFASGIVLQNPDSKASLSFGHALDAAIKHPWNTYQICRPLCTKANSLFIRPTRSVSFTWKSQDDIEGSRIHFLQDELLGLHLAIALAPVEQKQRD